MSWSICFSSSDWIFRCCKLGPFWPIETTQVLRKRHCRYTILSHRLSKRSTSHTFGEDSGTRGRALHYMFMIRHTFWVAMSLRTLCMPHCHYWTSVETKQDRCIMHAFENERLNSASLFSAIKTLRIRNENAPHPPYIAIFVGQMRTSALDHVLFPFPMNISGTHNSIGCTTTTCSHSCLWFRHLQRHLPTKLPVSYLRYSKSVA